MTATSRITRPAFLARALALIGSCALLATPSGARPARLHGPLPEHYWTDLLHLGEDFNTHYIPSTDTEDRNRDLLAGHGGDANQRPYPGLRYRLDRTSTRDNTLVWTPLHFPGGHWVPEPDQNNYVKYWHVYLVSEAPDDREVVFHFRHDDDIRMWNNGTLMVSRDGHDSGREYNQRGTIHAGVNAITIKLREGSGGDWMAMRVTDADDRPLADLVYSLSPPEHGILFGLSNPETGSARFTYQRTAQAHIAVAPGLRADAFILTHLDTAAPAADDPRWGDRPDSYAFPADTPPGAVPVYLYIRGADGTIHALESSIIVPDPIALRQALLETEMTEWETFLAAARDLEEAGWPPDTTEAGARLLIARQAWDACGAMGETALPPLVQALQAGPPEVRSAAATTLGGIGGDEAIRALIAAFGDENRTVREAALGALVKAGEPAIDPLSVAVRSGTSAGGRALAATALGQLDAPRGVPALRAGLVDDAGEVRARAAEALGLLLADTGTRSEEVVGELTAILADIGQDARDAAALALMRIGGAQAFAALDDAGYNDWPMWGYDASRRGASPMVMTLPDTLHLHWTREMPEPRRAWRRQLDDKDKLEFDLSYSPVVKDHRVFVPSMTGDSLTAYDLDTGRALWRTYAGGPVRLAPVAWEDYVFFVSDDGQLHCVAAETGDVIWTFNAVPTGHRVLGNERVISMWPARGGPVIQDGTLYFAAGVWPFLGTFLYAVDARSGEVQWANTGHATGWQPQPHGGAWSFAGTAPQGYIAVGGDRLVVSGGRAMPALFDRASGALLHSQVEGKDIGGYRVQVDGEHYFNHGRRYRLRDGGAAGSGRVEHEAVEALDRRVQAVRDQLDGPVFESLAARGRLLVVTAKGTLYCFGPEPREPVEHAHRPSPVESRGDATGRRAASILQLNRHPGGYALFLGTGDGDLIEQVAVRSDLHIVGIDPDAEKIAALRERFDRAGLYGTRIALIHDDPATAPYPPYISGLVVMEDPAVLGSAPDAAFLATVYERLRPYDGTAILFAGTDARAMDRALQGFEPENGRKITRPGITLLARDGALPGAGQWTHQYGDPAQTVLSRDDRVRPPLGPIWFGGPTNHNILPRHTTGPRPHVSAGRVVILGVEHMTARCVFTGRTLWEREFPGIGHFFTNMELENQWRQGSSVYMTNMPGATYIGSPYVTLADSIYLRYRGAVHRLDPATGETLDTFALPARTPDPGITDWGHVSVCGDYLVTTTDPHLFEGGPLGHTRTWDGTSSERLVVLDRHTGRVLWTRDAAVGFRHNAIASHGNRLFVIDALTEEALGLALRRGLDIQDRPRVYALDLSTGDVVWEAESEVFGTFLSYSAEHDVLVEGGTRDGRTHLGDEPSSRLIARRGSDGSVMWEGRGGDGPRILLGDTIIPGRSGTALSLLTGEPVQREHPITGEAGAWDYARNYGCGAANASLHMLLFRTGSAGFYDLSRDGGTMTLGGFKAGCTANLIAADGILNAPDYTRTCTCSYQNQTSLGLIHMPELEIWASNPTIRRVSGAIEQAGINLGAPGDRRADDGTLWVHHPRQAPSPDISVSVSGDAVAWFRKFSLFVDGSGGLPWVAASGVRGLDAFVLNDIGGGGRPYTVVLHFSEPDGLASGQRVFDIALDGVVVDKAFDVAREAGGADRATSRTYQGVTLGDRLRIDLTPAPQSAHPPVLSGVELIREE